MNDETGIIPPEYGGDIPEEYLSPIADTVEVPIQPEPYPDTQNNLVLPIVISIIVIAIIITLVVVLKKKK